MDLPIVRCDAIRESYDVDPFSVDQTIAVVRVDRVTPFPYTDRLVQKARSSLHDGLHHQGRRSPSLGYDIGGRTGDLRQHVGA